MNKICQRCKVEFLPAHRKQGYCPDCRRLKQTKYLTYGDYKRRNKVISTKIINSVVKKLYKPRKLEGIDTIRQKVRDRDNNTCQICGKEWVLGERKLDVHHLDVSMESKVSYSYDKNNMYLLITLCHKCHIGLPHNRKKISTGILNRKA